MLDPKNIPNQLTGTMIPWIRGRHRRVLNTCPDAAPFKRRLLLQEPYGTVPEDSLAGLCLSLRFTLVQDLPRGLY